VRAALTLAVAFVVVLAGTSEASASYLVTRNAQGISLRIAGTTAIVGYTTYGSRHHALLSGAVNAVRRAQVSRKSRSACATASAERAADRAGRTPARSSSSALPLATDPTAVIGRCKRGGGSSRTSAACAHRGSCTRPIGPATCRNSRWLDWSYAGRYQHLFGRYTYRGVPVHGFSSTHRGSPRDAYWRNLYLDTYDSSYGQGWRRENSFLSHKGTGVFCYGFYPHRGRRGTGSAYRLVVQGPGVTPLVSWTAESQGAFDPDLDSEMNALQRSLGDRLCRHG
jgi:hypothetical protein